jgi:hypothetical protein
MRATAAVALQQTVQGITHVSLLIFFSAAAGAKADLSHSYRRPRSCTWLPAWRWALSAHLVRAEAAALVGDGGAAAAQGGAERLGRNDP